MLCGDGIDITTLAIAYYDAVFEVMCEIINCIYIMW